MPWIDAAYGAALALSGDPGAADDLVQTTYLKAWERFDRFRPGTNCRAWLMRILRNTWYDRLRKHRPALFADEDAWDRLPAEPEGPDAPEPGDVSAHLERMDDERLVAALLQLPEPFRLVLLLVDVEEHTHAEVAEELGVAVGTIKSRASRGRRMLRQALAGGEQVRRSHADGGGEHD